MKILMVLTSHDQLGDSGQKTGFWLEEFAAPYYVFLDARADITLSSPAGEQPPMDPKSSAAEFRTNATERFVNDTKAQIQLAHTLPLAQINAADYDCVFYPGGHGPLWDLAEDHHSIRLIEALFQNNKPIGLVCHASGVLRHCKDANGHPLASGKRVTGFSNSEEAAVELTDVVPFLVEDMLRERGALYSKGDDWSSHIEVDGNLVSGQNPASSDATARAFLAQLGT